MIKICKIGFVLFFFLSCGAKKERAEQISSENNAPKKWVSYTSNNPIQKKRIVLVSGDEEYRSEEALPQLAKILSKRHGFDCTVLFAQEATKPGLVNPNHRHNIEGLSLLSDADLVIWFTRFRNLPAEQVQYLDDYLMQGKPLIAMRTTTHAFSFDEKNHSFAHYGWDYKGDKKDWNLGFGKKILGETWYVHHGNHKDQSTRGVFHPDAQGHPVLNGIQDGSIWGATDVYGIRFPLKEGTEILVVGQTIDRIGEFDENDLFYGMKETDTVLAKVAGYGDNLYNPNENMPPIVWKNPYQLQGGKKGWAITSTIGAATDLLDEEVRRLFVNASYHLLGLEVPKKADVSTVGDYNPSQFGFRDDAHWVEKNLRVEQLTKEVE